MRKAITIILLIVLLMSLVSCASISNIGHNSRNDDTTNTDKIVLVEETRGSWNNENEKYYSYQRKSGEIIYDWFPQYFADRNLTFINVPQEFSNGYAFIICEQDRPFVGGTFVSAPQIVTFEIIDEKGKKIVDKKYELSFSCGAYNTVSDYYYYDFDEYGYAYFEDENGDVYAIDGKTSSVTKVGENLFGGFKSLGKMVYSLSEKYILTNRDTVVDRQGNVIVDFYDTIKAIPINVEIIDDDTFKVLFKGKDEKNYVCKIDTDGNFVEKPKLLGS